VFAILGDQSHALHVADEAYVMLANCRDKRIRGLLLSEIAAGFARLGETERAVEAANHAVLAADDLVEPTVRAQILAGIAQTLLELGHEKSAAELAYKSLAAVQASNDDRVRCLVVCQIAPALYERGGLNAVRAALEIVTDARQRELVMVQAATVATRFEQRTLARQLWADAFKLARSAGREGLFHLLACGGVHALVEIETPDSPAQLYDTIVETERWWGK
jgi:hypothetical protein